MTTAKSKFVALAACAALVAMLGLAGCSNSSASSTADSATETASAIGDAGFNLAFAGIDDDDIQYYYAEDSEGGLGAVVIEDLEAGTYESYIGDLKNLDDGSTIQIDNLADDKTYTIKVVLDDKDGTIDATFENGKTVKMTAIDGEAFVTAVEAIGDALEKTN